MEHRGYTIRFIDPPSSFNSDWSDNFGTYEADYGRFRGNTLSEVCTLIDEYLGVNDDWNPLSRLS